MGLFSKFFGKLNSSDLDLSRPDFENAGIEDVNLGSISLAIRDPQQTANIPFTSSVKNLDLDDISHFDKNKDGSFSQLLYKRGWNFLGNGGEPRGGVIASIVTTYAPEDYKQKANFFNRDELKQVAVEHCHIMWGRQNKAKCVGDSGTGRIQYPTNIEQVEIKSVNGIDYAVAVKQSKNTPPTVCYFVVLTERHTADIMFKIGAYESDDDFDSVDIDSPDTNLKEVAYWTIDQFISHLEINR